MCRRVALRSEALRSEDSTTWWPGCAETALCILVRALGAIRECSALAVFNRGNKIMHGYIAFYNGRRHELHADTSLAARDKAAAHFKVKPNRAYMVSVVHAETNGQQVTNTADF
jgi:hypothetical protein